jgi:hypothetical protein
MTGYDNLPALLAHVPNSWEREPLLYARGQGIKTRIIKNKKEGGLGGALSKKSYAESVYLMLSEYEKLERAYGEANTRRAIQKLSAYKGANGRHYKSDYKAILNWAMAAVLGTKSAAVPEPIRTSFPHPVCDVPGCGKVCSRGLPYWECPEHGPREGVVG